MSKRTLTGVVSSIAGNKTIVVTRTVRKTHPLYGKRYTTSRKFHAHDEANDAKVGDAVVIEESKPYSRTVVWTMKQILSRGHEKLEIKQSELEQELEAGAEGHTKPEPEEEA